MKLRHLPTVVHGVEWDDSDEARAELETLGFTDADGYYEPTASDGGPRTLMIRTLEGGAPRAAVPGEHWILQGTQLEWYPVSNAVRHACYRPVGDVASYRAWLRDQLRLTRRIAAAALVVFAVAACAEPPPSDEPANRVDVDALGDPTGTPAHGAPGHNHTTDHGGAS